MKLQPSKRQVVFIVVVVLALIATVWIFFALITRRSKYLYSGTVETREITVGSKVGGRVTEVFVEEGQSVKAGALLVRFECDALKAQRAQAAAAVDEAQADLDRMIRGNRPEEIQQAEAFAKAQHAALDAAENGPRSQDIDQAKADYAAAKADEADAEVFFRRMEPLAAHDVISRQQMDDARDKRDATAQKAEALRQHLALLQAGTRVEDLKAAREHFRQAAAAAALSRKGFRKEDIDAARGRLAEAQGKVAEMDVSLKEAELLAPANSLVEVVSVRPGDLIPPGQIVVTLLEPSQLWVKVYIAETELSHVHLGQPARIKIDGFSGRNFSGTVEQIASQAEFLPRNVQTRDDREHQVFGVKVHVDNSEGILKSGMSASVELK
jgi:multidrug resistance efflux pump